MGSAADSSLAGMCLARGPSRIVLPDSATVPQASHSPHRPAHFVVRQPHAEHS
jgi:hypothetical protein